MSIPTIHDNENNIYQSLEGTHRNENNQLSQPDEKSGYNIPENSDAYLPDEPVGEPVKGIYSAGHDADGKLTINYVEPNVGDEKSVPVQISASNTAPAGDDDFDSREIIGKTKSDRSSSTTINTDRVDSEIKKLKEQKQLIQQRIRAEFDDERKAELQSQLQQINVQLSQKDNDFYRRQNAVVL